MITLAQRVRDFRYSKGWGPDELASRAEISRTALYQIESGKTGLPRAGTLRRIAIALDVSMEELLGNTESAGQTQGRLNHESVMAPRGREFSDWIPGEGGPLALPGGPQSSSVGQVGTPEEARNEERFGNESLRRGSVGFDSLLMREGELMSKLHDLLHSPMGAGIARLVDDLHLMLARPKSSV